MATPWMISRFRFFALLGLLVPLFAAVQVLVVREGTPRTEVRLVPQSVPVIVEVPVERIVDRIVERTVYVEVTATPTATPPAPASNSIAPISSGVATFAGPALSPAAVAAAPGAVGAGSPPPALAVDGGLLPPDIPSDEVATERLPATIDATSPPVVESAGPRPVDPLMDETTSGQPNGPGVAVPPDTGVGLLAGAAPTGNQTASSSGRAASDNSDDSDSSDNSDNSNDAGPGNSPVPSGASVALAPARLAPNPPAISNPIGEVLLIPTPTPAASVLSVPIQCGFGDDSGGGVGLGQFPATIPQRQASSGVAASTIQPGRPDVPAGARPGSTATPIPQVVEVASVTGGPIGETPPPTRVRPTPTPAAPKMPTLATPLQSAGNQQSQPTALAPARQPANRDGGDKPGEASTGKDDEKALPKSGPSTVPVTRSQATPGQAASKQATPVSNASTRTQATSVPKPLPAPAARPQPTATPRKEQKGSAQQAVKPKPAPPPVSPSRGRR